MHTYTHPKKKLLACKNASYYNLDLSFCLFVYYLLRQFWTYGHHTKKEQILLSSYKMITSMNTWESGWKPHLQGASFIKSEKCIFGECSLFQWTPWPLCTFLGTQIGCNSPSEEFLFLDGCTPGSSRTELGEAHYNFGFHPLIFGNLKFTGLHIKR